MGADLIVQVKEKSLVLPAEETYKGLYFLSNNDLFVPLRVPTVYCYKPSGEGKGTDEVVEVIKNALSKVLVPYYPAAGRLTLDSDGRVAVDCNGEGVTFIEAEASCSIEDIGDNTFSMSKLTYGSPDVQNPLEVPPMTVQVTMFKDGAFVVGLCLNHIIFDGAAAMQFINSWADVARGLPLDQVTPFLDRTILKARNLPKIEHEHHEFSELEDVSNLSELYKEELVDKFFHFNQKKLERLKMQALLDGVIQKCSTFDVLSAFVWRARSEAQKVSHDQKIKTLIVVDSRSRFDPPLPGNYAGNGIAFVCAVSTAGDLTKKPLSYGVGLIQQAVKSATDGYMRSAIDYLQVNGLDRPPTMTATLVITAWTRLSFESADFGWGKPFLTGRASTPGHEQAMLISHPTEKRSVGVLISLPASSMKIFEKLVQG